MKKITLLLIVLITAISCGKQNGQKIEISSIKMKYDGSTLNISSNVKNLSSEEIKGGLCIRLYDKDNFELDKFSSDDIKLGASNSEDNTGKGYVKDSNFDNSTLVKIYFGKYKCADSVSETLSNVTVLEKKDILVESSSKNTSNKNSEKTNSYLTDKKYTFYEDGSCKPSSEVICLSKDEYKNICSVASGVTSYAIQLRATLAPNDEKTLLTGGKIENIMVMWGKTYSGNEICGAVITASGLVDGNSKRLDIQGMAKVFIKNSEGEILVSYFE